MAKGGYVYIVSNKTRSTLYTGVTSNLYARAYEHKFEEGSVFTKKYRCTALVYYEFHPTIEKAIIREKRIKRWKRVWKEELIQKLNPGFDDLFPTIEDMQ